MAMLTRPPILNPIPLPIRAPTNEAEQGVDS